MFMTGAHADTAPWILGASFGFAPGFILHGMVRENKTRSRKYHALEVKRDAELAELAIRQRWVRAAIDAERK